MSPSDDAWVILNTDHLTNIPEHYVVVPEEYKDGVEHLPQEFLEPNPEKANYGEIVKETFVDITGLESDYILIYLAAQRYTVVNQLTGDEVYLYDLSYGGDESKKYWFANIAGLNPAEYVASDGITPSQKFDNTLLGKLIPFTVVVYIDIDTLEYYNTYKPGLTTLYVKDIKFTDPDGPFVLEYASPSFYDEGDGSMLAVLIYKINHNFIQ